MKIVAKVASRAAGEELRQRLQHLPVEWLHLGVGAVSFADIECARYSGEATVVGYGVIVDSGVDDLVTQMAVDLIVSDDIDYIVASIAVYIN